MRIANTEIPTGNVTALVVVTAMVIGVTILLLVWQTSRITTSGYDLQALEQTKLEWEYRNLQLEDEVSRLGSLATIETQARSRLGMTAAASIWYVPVTATAQLPPPGALRQPEGQVAARLDSSTGSWAERLLHMLTRFFS